MLRRILALMLKELAALWKDPKTRRVILIPPLMQVILFSYSASYDVTHVALGVWNEDAGAQSAELVRRFAASPAFHIVAAPQSPAQVRQELDDTRVAAVLHLPQDFSGNLLRGRTAQAELLVDARRSNTALLLQGYAADIVAGYATGLHPGHTPLVLLTRDWFNPTLESKWFILPGLVCVLSMIMSLLISALALARERELGTLEQLLVTPLRPVEILLGKAMPGIIVGMLDANIVVLAAFLWFRVPFRGDLILLQAMLLLFTLTGTAIGLAISSIARTQQQGMLGVFVIASPMIVLSGYAAPVENMPRVVEIISRADPVRYMLVAARGVFLQDMPLAVVAQQAWPMAIIAAVMLTVAGIAVRRAVA